MKSLVKAKPAPAGSFANRWRRPHPCAFFVTAMLVCASLHAQTVAPGSADEPGKAEEDSSQRVDESEESYRTRMELRDQRYREQKRADMIYSTPAGTSKLDQLPEASREHIKRQMREMIIASRQWKPGEDVSDYPYEPSEAAQTDAKLRNQEREAWAEQLEKYQQREAAAYANTQGGQSAPAGGQEGSKGSADDSSGATAASAGQSQEDAARKPDSYAPQEHEAETVSTAGVAENALSFLQGKDGQAGVSESPAEAAGADESGLPAVQDSQAGGGAADEVPPGSLSLSELALLQGMSQAAPDSASGSPAAQQPVGSSTTSAAPKASENLNREDSTAPKDGDEALPGTLIIDELNNMSVVVSMDSTRSEKASAAVENSTQAAVRNVEPGTLDIDELKHLDGN